MPTQRETFLRALRRWASETRQDAHPLLLYGLHCIGHPEGDQPIDMAAALHPLDMVSVDALSGQLDRLIDQVGVGEDFLVTSLVRAVEEHFERLRAGREESLAMFRSMLAEIEGLEADPERAEVFLAARGLRSGDLAALTGQVGAEIARLEDPAWDEVRQRDVEVWRRVAAPLLSPVRRDDWERQRFAAASQQLTHFFKGPEGTGGG